MINQELRFVDLKNNLYMVGGRIRATIRSYFNQMSNTGQSETFVVALRYLVDGNFKHVINFYDDQTEPYRTKPK